MRSLALLMLVAVMGVAHADPIMQLAPKLPNRVTSEEINDFVDRLINEIKKYIIDNNLDPMPLPDLVEGFEWEDFLGIVWHGEASLRNGQMQGITSLYRNGDADFTYDTLNLTVSAQMALLAIKVDYDFEASFMDLGPTGHAEITSANILFDFSFSIDMLSGTATLHSFDIGKVGPIDVEITGLGSVLDWLVELFVNLFVDIFKRVILNILENVLEDAMRDALANISLGLLVL